MGNKRHKNKIRPDVSNSSDPKEGARSDPNSLSPWLPRSLTIVAILAVYGWMLSWSNWFLYTHYTSHFQDNFHVLAAFYKLIASIRINAIEPNLRDMAWACAIFMSAFGLGRIVLDLLKAETEDNWGRNLRALAVGLGLFSLALLLLGLAGLWVRWTMLALVFTPLVVGWGMYRPGILVWIQTRDPRTRLKELTLLEAFGFALLGSFLVLNFMSALGPEYFYDSLVYHLAMPKLYLLHKRIIATPSMIYSGVPFATEMLYGLGLSLGTETLAKLIHYGFGVAIAAAIYSWCQRFINRKVALLATLLFYSAPLVCFASSVAKVELALTFYLLLAALLILEVPDRPAGQDTRLLLLAGALAGLAFGTKYNAGLYVPALALPLIYRQFRGEQFEPNILFKQLAIFFGSAALVSSPWLIKNWIFYHNPTYPFLNDFFGGSISANVAGLKSDAHARDLAAAFTTWAGFRNFIIDIWNPAAHAMDGYVGPALEIGVPWLFLVRWKSTQHRGLFIILIGIWLAWALHSTLSRFFLPAIPIFCILVASALWLVQLPRALRFLIVGVFYYTITISMAKAFLMLAQPGAWKVAYGRATKADYLLHEHPSYNAPYYAGAKFINENLPQDAVVLFIGEERGYYCERKFITASVLDVNPMLDLANSSAHAADLLANLKRRNITHLLVNTGSEHYHRWLESLAPESRIKYENFLKQKAELIFNHAHDLPNDRAWVQVYKLLDS